MMRCIAGTVAFLSLSAASAHVAEAPTELDDIDVYASADTGVTPSASSGRIDRDELDAHASQRTGDLLELIPGFITTQHSGEGKANQYFARGFNLDHGTDFAVSIEGVPLNLSSHGHGQGYLDLNFLIPELLAGYDYRKGSYSLRDGDFATAGSAELRWVDDAPNLIQGSVGEYGERRGLVAGSLRGATSTLIAGVDYSVNDGPWELPMDQRAARGLLRWLRETADRRISLTLGAYDNRWTSSDQVPERAVADGRIDRYGFVDPTSGGDTHRYMLAFSLWTRDGETEMSGGFYAVDYRLQLFSNFTYFLDDPVDGDQFEQFDDRRYYGTHLDYRRGVSLFGRDAAVVAGFAARLDRIGDVGLYRTTARERVATVRRDRIGDLRIGSFVGLDWSVTDWMQLLAGTRLDPYDYDVDSRSGLLDRRGSELQWSPKLSLVLGPWAATEVFVNAGRGFHSNDARGDDGSPGFDPLVVASGAEIGLRSTPATGLELAAALWALELDSELVYVGDAGQTEPNNGSRRRGAEFSVRYHPLDWLGFDADWTVTRARLDAAPGEDRIPNAIPRAGRASIGVRVMPTLRLGLQVRHFDGAPLVEDGSVTARDSTRADLLLRWAATPKLSLRAELLNVFDESDADIEYYYESRLADETQAVADRHFHPALPRLLRLTLRAEF
ncbi:MAG: TonB-dependent receptor plug domain-containing protein [Pseudomonadota bacterium]|nr:TonB-dependent receptor plug domain-containing protein [Pseudomonadota bacterium]